VLNARTEHHSISGNLTLTRPTALPPRSFRQRNHSGTPLVAVSEDIDEVHAGARNIRHWVTSLVGRGRAQLAAFRANRTLVGDLLLVHYNPNGGGEASIPVIPIISR